MLLGGEDTSGRSDQVSKASKKRLVVVDDDIDLREQLAAFFEGAFDVTTFEGGQPALRALRDAPPDALLLDIDLQDIKGFDVLKLMNSTPALRAAPVIVLSATNDFETFEQAHRLGIAEYVTKPFRVEDLRDKLAARHRPPPPAQRRPPQAGRHAGRKRHRQPGPDRRRPHRQQQAGGRLGEVLVASGLVSEDDLIHALAGQMHLTVVDLRAVTPNPAAVGLLPRDFIVRHRLLPLRLDDNGGL